MNRYAALLALATALAACGASPPEESEDGSTEGRPVAPAEPLVGPDALAARCAASQGVDVAAAKACDSDDDCPGWCMLTCSFFHAVKDVSRCAPLKLNGAWCDHVGGDHECMSGHCGAADACD